jgi:membrane protein
MDRLKNLLLKLKILFPRGIEIYRENKMSVYSGYATLFIVTAVFPCIILIISVVNLIPGYSAKDVADVLLQILPDLGAVRDLVLSLMTDIKDQSGGMLASAAAITTLWAANKGTSAIQKGLNQLDEEKEEGCRNEEKGGLFAKVIIPARGILKQLVFTLMLVLLIPALLIFEMMGDSIAGAISSAVKKVSPDVMNSTLANIESFFHISSLVVVVLALLVIMAIFAILPERRRTLTSQLPGAILTGLGWFLFTQLFSFFIPRFYHASNLYGSLASLFLVLLWLRFIIMILFAGGVLNHSIEKQLQAVKRR